MVLRLRGISKRFGGLQALRNVGLNVNKGEIHALIGPNGAGKTTLLNIISGIVRPDKGEVLFNGDNINGESPEKRARIGLARTFQHLEVFNDMTVIDNVMVGRHIRSKIGFFRSGLILPGSRTEERSVYRYCCELLDYIGLSHRRDDLAKNLPVGEQRLLEIGRALATEPELLLLDEPAAGLNIRETRGLGELIERIRRQRGTTILIVEHDMELVMKISDNITVLNFGEVIAEGSPFEIQKNPQVISAYLGED